MSTYNNFKNTTIRGNFKNSDYADNSILASATFDRNVYVKGDLYLGNETSTTFNGVTTYSDTSGNIILKINGITYTISPSDFIKVLNIPDKLTLSDLSTYLTTTNNYIQSSYLTTNNFLQKTTADSYYLTQTTADNLYQTKFTDVNGSFDPNLFLSKADASLNYVSKSNDITTSNNINLTSISNKINLNGTGTSLYDNGNFHLDTTNSMYVSAPTQLSITSPSTSFSGNVTIATSKSLTTPAITLNGYDLTTRLGEIVTAFGQSSMPKAGGTFTGDVTLAATKKLVTPEITLNGSDLQGLLNLKAPLASPSFTGTVSGITKTMVGLGSVDNTSDVDKPVSTAQQTALNLKMNKTGGTFSGDATIQSGSKLFFSNPNSAIYDDAQLRITTDDQMYLSTGTTNNCLIDLTSKDIKLNGATTITGNRLYFTDELSSGYNSSFIESYQGKLYLSTQNGLIFRDGPTSYTEYCYLNSSGLEVTGSDRYVKAPKITLGTNDLQGLLNAKMDKTGGTFSGGVTITIPQTTSNSDAALIIQNSAPSTSIKQIVLLTNVNSGSYNSAIVTGDSVILAKGADINSGGINNTNVLCLTTHASGYGTGAIRITKDSVDIAGTNVTINGYSANTSFKGTIKLIPFSYDDYQIGYTDLKAFYYTSNSGFYTAPYRNLNSYYSFTIAPSTTTGEITYDANGLLIEFPNPNDKQFIVNINGVSMNSAANNNSLAFNVYGKGNGHMLNSVRHSYFYIRWSSFNSSAFLDSRTITDAVVSNNPSTFFYTKTGLNTNSYGYIDILVSLI